MTTEKKFPVIHLILGEFKAKDDELAANFEVIAAAVHPKNIKKAVICSTMGPGVKVNPETKKD